MKLAPKDGGYTPVPAGRYTAIVYQIVDIGTQKTSYKGEEKFTQQLVIAYELHGAQDINGKPFSLRKTFTASLGAKSKLRPHLGALRGKAIADDEIKTDHEAAALMRSFIGKAGDMVIDHRKYVGSDGQERTAEEIISVSPPHPQVPVPKMVNPSLFFDLNNYTREEFDSLPQYLRDKIVKSPEYKGQGFYEDQVIKPSESTQDMAPSVLPADFDDEIPF